jgi:hypothetical protein
MTLADACASGTSWSKPRCSKIYDNRSRLNEIIVFLENRVH